LIDARAVPAFPSWQRKAGKVAFRNKSVQVLFFRCEFGIRHRQDKAVAFLLLIALYSDVLVLWRYNVRDLCRASKLAHAPIISTYTT
ncbi:MAG: hypothetical protein WCH04_22165, partial [Gammaproteobacteria bacterium]